MKWFYLLLNVGLILSLSGHAMDIFEYDSSLRQSSIDRIERRVVERELTGDDADAFRAQMQRQIIKARKQFHQLTKEERDELNAKRRKRKSERNEEERQRDREKSAIQTAKLKARWEANPELRLEHNRKQNLARAADPLEKKQKRNDYSKEYRKKHPKPDPETERQELQKQMEILWENTPSNNSKNVEEKEFDREISMDDSDSQESEQNGEVLKHKAKKLKLVTNFQLNQLSVESVGDAKRIPKNPKREREEQVYETPNKAPKNQKNPSPSANLIQNMRLNEQLATISIPKTALPNLDQIIDYSDESLDRNVFQALLKTVEIYRKFDEKKLGENDRVEFDSIIKHLRGRVKELEQAPDNPATAVKILRIIMTNKTALKDELKTVRGKLKLILGQSEHKNLLINLKSEFAKRRGEELLFFCKKIEKSPARTKYIKNFLDSFGHDDILSGNIREELKKLR